MGALTNYDGTDQFQLRYLGNDSAPIVRGTNYTAVGIQTAIQNIAGWPAGGTATVSAVSDTSFTVTFGGTLANTDVDELELVNCTGCTGFTGEIAKGGQTTRHGAVTATGDSIPTVTTPASFTIPLRTPFALTGSGSDADGDPLTYLWEQNDAGSGSGTGLVDNNKLNGPLFRQFSVIANVSDEDTLQYDSPGENHATADPTRVFPDLDQVLANNTNADGGTCPPADPTPTPAQIDCFSEFLPNGTYQPTSLHFRVTVRDGRGGVNGAPVTLTLAPSTGFRVTSPDTAVTWEGGSQQNVTWATGAPKRRLSTPPRSRSASLRTAATRIPTCLPKPPRTMARRR